MSNHIEPPSIADRQPSITMRLRSWLPHLLILSVYVGCAVLVDPRGEFPLNDDWSYSRSAFKFGTEGTMLVDEWAAPNLVGQALYGGLLTKVFGPSFLALRISTLLLSSLAACLLWSALRRLNVDSGASWAAVLAWIFNPVWFCLSFTYMTEIPFLFSVILALWFFLLHLGDGKLRFLLACGGALGYAFLIRQTSVLFIGPMFLALLLFRDHNKLRRRISQVLLWAGTAGVFIAGYSLWSQQHGGSTPAAQRKYELLARITTTQVLGNSFGLLFYLAFFCLPLLIFRTPSILRHCREYGNRAWVWAAAWLFVSGSGMWWFHSRYARVPYLPSRAFHAQMPFLLNILYDTGLGPVTLDPTYYGRPPAPVHPHIWLFVTYLSAAGAVLLGLSLTLSAIRFRWSASDPIRRRFYLCCALALPAVVIFEVVFSHTEEGGLFDRHIITAALPLLFLSVLSGDTSGKSPPGEEGDQSVTRPSKAASAPGQRRNSRPVVTDLAYYCRILTALVLAILAWFSIASTHDYLAWNRLRWELGNQLLAAKANPLNISGGFEFNAWHNYDTYRARGNIGKVYYWWYDQPEYLITMEPQEAYHILQKKEYLSWLHRRRLPVYSLERDKPD